MLEPPRHTACSRAMEEDPNKGRCSVENCPKHRGVQAMHVLPREVTETDCVMRSLEYSWNLRRGTLNLDTRRNILFVGKSLAAMYARGCWVLLPEESVMDQFVHPKLGIALGRVEFPALSPPFNYRFVPVRDMDDVGVVHQNESPPTSGNSFTNHVYPFKTLPLIKSHVHPQFAIVAIGKVLYTPSVMTKPLRQKLFAEFPAVKKVYELYGSWTSTADTPAALKYSNSTATHQGKTTEAAHPSSRQAPHITLTH
ncbi:hypothetical protein FA13DRAFT_1812521 [Coprinellus micaceus]|uniref:HNH nuclease domain-containing protein n=1 Tax=Coprinellus micaceus TaxID=71717 RepID=A0A4Y7TIH7_COPMI|nr:hypothetical protein FA13DRAFT_1812521 [Coprinellus micaceus]